LIRVHIETASAVTRAGLEAILGGHQDIEIVNVAPEADVLLREHMPELSDGAGEIPVVVLADETPSMEALRSGARAVLAPDAPPQQIIAAIYAAAAGLAVVPVEDTAPLLPHAPVEEVTEPLTPREMDVLEMLAEGMSNKAIAHGLSISEHTAKFHVNSILAKLRAGTRTEAVMRGIRLGLVKI
jgi:two-component system, NarL family, nitrate/nitrite response regulator NarL